MFASRLIPALRAPLRQAALRRGYADVADGKLALSLVLPHQSIYSSSGVYSVNIPASSGDMNIYANHVPVVEALNPGVIEVIEDSGSQGKKWFISAGFATVHANNSLTINAVEAYPLDKISPENVRAGLADAQRVLSSNAPDAEKEEANIEIEVYQSLQHALSQK
ncbi:F1 complex, delta/epsilon subunit of ATPase [Papiliotrema laurentii]|uniref:ATP synthase subunit delta, mitochondrial n=1 Tax=Papiliotrema laurentii TaxID=5418 RepID=A0AAD9FR10_PAPLA|nr:F1 complex, delta/epsilon subunit of ATPase [Papiliotrema laurentii]